VICIVKTSKKKKIGMLAITIIATTVLITTLFSGCTQQNKTTISLGGSTTVQPIAESVAEAFMKLYPNITVQVYGGGSSVGIKGVAQGTYDIGDASRSAVPDDVKDISGVTFDQLVPHQIALDGIAIIVSKQIYDAGVIGITKNQLKGIYNNTINNWNEVGGPDEAIFVVGRDTSSGTYASFNDMLKLNETTQILDKASTENAQVKAAVGGAENAIGYVGLGFVGSTTPALKLNGILPTADTVKDTTYPLSRSLFMYTKGEATGAAKMFIDFVLSPDGQAIVEQEEFIPLT
jgi:phosphate transport system substrate-binding protein